MYICYLLQYHNNIVVCITDNVPIRHNWKISYIKIYGRSPVGGRICTGLPVQHLAYIYIYMYIYIYICIYIYMYIYIIIYAVINPGCVLVSLTQYLLHCRNKIT